MKPPKHDGFGKTISVIINRDILRRSEVINMIFKYPVVPHPKYDDHKENPIPVLLLYYLIYHEIRKCESSIAPEGFPEIELPKPPTSPSHGKSFPYYGLNRIKGTGDMSLVLEITDAQYIRGSFKDKTNDFKDAFYNRCISIISEYKKLKDW